MIAFFILSLLTKWLNQLVNMRNLSLKNKIQYSFLTLRLSTLDLKNDYRRKNI